MHPKDQTYHKSSSRPIAAAADDPFAFLSDFDTVFLIDDSGSMYGERWNQTRAALEAIVPICTSHDSDGIDIYFLNNTQDRFNFGFRNVTSLHAVKGIFDKVSPDGTTPTGKRLEDIIRPYLKKITAVAAAERRRRHVAVGEGETTTMTTTTAAEEDPKAIKASSIVKPLNIIVITDGCPSDEKHLESVIVNTARELDSLDPPAPAWQIGIQFFQVGKDQRATESLMGLDDKLKDKYKIRDMVDTVPWKSRKSSAGGGGGEPLDGNFILKVVTGAVNRRLDRCRVVV